VSHREPTDEVLDQAALYALGAMDAADAAAFEAHLREGCPVCEREVGAFSATAAQLALAAAPRPPRPEVRQRLLQRVAGAAVVRSADRVWRPGPVAGSEVAVLFAEPLTGRLTGLIRLHAGAEYPSHRHADTEELYVLEGDMALDEVRLGAGDYCAAPAGTAHRRVRTADGCLFLLLASQRDAVVPAAEATSPVEAFTVVRASEGAWAPTGSPGVVSRPLFRDTTRGTTTALVRMAPATHLAAHRHLSPEQFYLLDGEARVGPHHLVAGDYYRAEGGTAPEGSATEGGCTLLVISSRIETARA
jgi:putative transcriptional regulator